MSDDQNTVTVRIALAVDANRRWDAQGANAFTDDEAMDLAVNALGRVVARYWITVTVPVPEPQEIAGKVEAAGDA